MHLRNVYIYMQYMYFAKRKREIQIVVINYVLIIRTFQFQRLCAWEDVGKG